ncbi:MAG: DUF3385 domain-containing protein, partial [archaeon]|nr:DUF3385 domain-containing protein [archaeon]
MSRAGNSPAEEDATEERWKDRLSHYFQLLKDDFQRNPNDIPEDRPVVARFRDYLTTQLRDLPSSSAGKFINQLSSFIGNSLHAPLTPDKLSALTAIILLIDLDDGTQSGRTITRVINWLRSGLESTDHNVTTLACTCLGRVVKIEGTLAAECAESEVSRALKWIEGIDKVDKRFTGILMLKELALNSPTCFFIHVKDFFQKMWFLFKDKSLQLREFAAECLSLALVLIHQREDICRLYYRIILEEAQRNIQTYKDKKAEIEPLHGSLLVIGCLLIDPGSILDDCFANLVSTVMQFKDHRDKLIRGMVISIFPKLAKANPYGFQRQVLDDAMDFLFASLKNPEHEGAAFVAIGEIIFALSDDQFVLKISPFIDRTTHLIKSALQPRKASNHLGPIYSCIEKIASSLGSSSASHMHELLPIVFQNTQISLELSDVLSTVASVVPSLLSEIQERLLNLISLILAQQPFDSLNATLLTGLSRTGPSSSSSAGKQGPSLNRGVSRTKTLSAQNRKSSHSIIPLPRDDKTIFTALRILGSFDFNPTTNLTCFVREVVLDYVDDWPDPVRQEAATVSINLAVHAGEQAPTTGKYAPVVSEVLEKLLALGVTDQSERLRTTIFKSLDERYDSHLGNSENLQSLFLALNDEVFEIRSYAMAIIGRLALRNPAYVMPSLRKKLIQLVTELHFSSDFRIQEECCKLLMSLIRSAGRLMRAYVPSILAALIPKLQDASKRVTPTILAACGELSPIAGTELKEHLSLLFSFSISCLHDQSSIQKRLTALKAMRKFTEYLGYVVQPYFDYPVLMSLLTTMLKTEHSTELRTELLAVLGVLGAIDPYEVTILNLKQQDESASDSIRQAILAGHQSYFGQAFSPSIEFFSGEALRELMKILADPSLSIHHGKVVHIMMYICKLLGSQTGKFLPQIMPLFIAAMHGPEKGVAHEFLIQQVGTLIQLTSSSFIEYLGDVFSLIKNFWKDSKLISHLLILLE